MYMDVCMYYIRTWMYMYVYTCTYIHIHSPAYTYVLNYDTDKRDVLMGFKVFVKFLGKFPQFFLRTLQGGNRPHS
jgi:hypothetical protein